MGRALRIGGFGAIIFIALDVLLFSTAPRVGLCVWAFTMVAVLFALTEFVVPASPAVRSPQSETSLFAARYARSQEEWSLPSPIEALVVSTPFFGAIAAIALFEGLVTV